MGKSVAKRRREIQELADLYNFVQDSNGAEEDCDTVRRFQSQPRRRNSVSTLEANIRNDKPVSTAKEITHKRH